MALIKCPECGKELSDRALNCIQCGYPLDEKNESMHTSDYFENDDIAIINGKKIDLYEIVKIYGNTFFSKVGASVKLSTVAGISEEEAKVIINEYYKKIGDRSNISFIDGVVNQFTSKNPIKGFCNVKCPTCGSENVQHISSTERATNIAMFGLFGNKRKMQFKCNKCTYMW